MFCYIPLATGQSISKDVYRSLAAQTINIDIIPCCTEGTLISNKNLSIEKVIHEMGSRNLAIDLINKSNEEFVLMQDRDCLHLLNNNYEIALEYMGKNPIVGILSLPHLDFIRGMNDHVIMRSMIIRKQAVKNFRFRFDRRSHLCPCMVEDLKKENWICEYYLSEKKMINELI